MIHTAVIIAVVASPFYDDPGGGLSEPLVLTDNLDMGGYDVLNPGDIDWGSACTIDSPADGQLRIMDDAETTGAVIDCNDAADTCVIKDLAGTGAADLQLLTTGRLYLDDGRTDYLYSDGTYLTIRMAGANVVRTTPTSTSIYGAMQVLPSSTGNSTFNLFRINTTPTDGDLISEQNTVHSPTSNYYTRAQHYMEDVTAIDGSTKYSVKIADVWTVMLALDGKDEEVETPSVPIRATGGLNLPVQTGATPSAPYSCDATHKGKMEVVDDNDDGAGTTICYCGMTDDTTYDWLEMDNTACPFY